MIGGKWKALIVWHLAPNPLRFGELRRMITGITEKMLIQQLRELEADGVVHRKVYHEVPPKVEYSLTEFGRSLRAVLEPLCEWGTRHMRRMGARHPGDEVCLASPARGDRASQKAGAERGRRFTSAERARRGS